MRITSLLLACLLYPGLAPAQQLPTPTGRYAVGVRRLALVDSARPEPMTAATTDFREVVVQVWYPALQGSGRVAAYVTDSLPWAEAFGLNAVRRFSQVRPTARLNASAIAGERWPVALLTPASGNDPGFYAVLAEELASRGFVTIALGHPYERPTLRLANGALAVPPGIPESDTGVVRVARDRITWRVGDLRFLLSQLASARTVLRNALSTIPADTDRVVVIGHSRGGVAALEACKLDHRFRGCINLDGGVLGGPYYDDAAGVGPRGPTLWLQAYHPPPSDAQLASWRMTRVQWDSFDIRANRLLARSRGGAWRVVVPDIEHQAFSDLGWLQADSMKRDSALRTLLSIRELVAHFAEAAAAGRAPHFTSIVEPQALQLVQHVGQADWGSWIQRPLAQIDSLTRRAWTADSVGGVVLGVQIGDSLVHTIALGVADRRTTRPMTANDVFRVGSITKQFTALMLLQLAESRRVSLTDPVTRFVPEAAVLERDFPRAPPITLFQLATHMSGLPREPDELGLDRGSSARWDTLVLRGLRQTHLLSEPGTTYRYSNFGYALLGLALSRAAGEPYEQYVQRHILDPLGMQSTGFRTPPMSTVATGYDVSLGGINDRLPALEHQGRGYKVPNGALYSTVADLARFLSFETGGGPDSVLIRAALDRNYKRLAYVNQRMTDAAGAGFVIVREGDLIVYGHAGTVAGYDAITGFDPERQLGVIVLRNATGGRLDTYRLMIDAMRLLRAARHAALEQPLQEDNR